MATEADNIWETGAEPPREPPARFRVLRRLAGGIAVALLALLALGVLNPLGHDDTDRLPPPLRKSVVQALRSAPGCSGWMPNARIASISRLSNDVGLENGFRYRCTWTLLGWPSFSGVARCADGAWIVPGWMEPEQTSTRCGVLTN